jgi:type 1 glutamine amidotransferase/HEAT repeat protein
MTLKNKLFITMLFLIQTLLTVTLLAEEIDNSDIEKIRSAMPSKYVAEPKKPRKMLVFYLCGGFKHGSIPYWNKALEIMGEKTGAFETVFSNDMSSFAPENLQQFDAICFNNNTEVKFPKELQKSLMDFIKSGKGIVGIHAATDSFYDWPQAAHMFGGQFCGHPWTADGTWAVKLDDPNHPLMAAFEGENFKINDEIYRTIPPYYSRTTQRILMSLDMSDRRTANAEGMEPFDKDMAISWVKSVGKGRLFYCSLGHNNHITWNPAVLQHDLAGIQFALGDYPVDTASSLEILLNKIAKYESDNTQQPLYQLDEYIRNVVYFEEELKRYEKHFISFLKTDATLDGKYHICRKLAQIGTEESVPVLQEMLTNEETSEMARYALEEIPSPAADQALRKALNNTTGKTRIGIINSIGRRRDENAVDDLKNSINDSDTTTAVAAVAALAQIGTPQAAEALEQELDTSNTDLKAWILDSYLKCAYAIADKGKNEQAFVMFEKLYQPQQTTTVRIASLRGMAQTSPKKANQTIIEAAKSDDLTIQTAAIQIIRENPDIKDVKPLISMFDDLAPQQKIQVLSAMADRSETAMLDKALEAAESSEESLRIAAYQAISKIGNTSTVSTLAKAAASTTGYERNAARQSLYDMKDKKTDKEIIKQIPKADSKIKAELIRSVAQRKIKNSTEILLKSAKDSDRNVRIESYRALQNVAGPRQFPELLDLIMDIENTSELKEALRAISSASRAEPEKSIDLVLTKLDSAQQADKRAVLLQILGNIEHEKSLTVLKSSLNDKEDEVKAAAIRALSDWPNDQPLNELMNIAENSENQIHRALAFRGAVRLIGLNEDRPAQKAAELYKKALELASNNDEKKMILSALSRAPSLEALQLAGQYLKNPDTKEEAAVAVVRISMEIAEENPQRVAEYLRTVLDVSDNEDLIEWTENLLERLE